GIATRIEADIDEQHARDSVSEARARVEPMLDAWLSTYSPVTRLCLLVAAMHLGVLAEAARVGIADAVGATAAAADAFHDLDRPYSEIYFRWRNARARLAVGDRDGARHVLSNARKQSAQYGFATLSGVIAQ